MEQLVKLNLGCGNKIVDGYINIDLPDNSSGIKPDVQCDITKLPYEDDYADEVMAIHVIEHLYIWDVPNVLKEWRRVLKPGGLIAIECPDIDKVLDLFIRRRHGEKIHPQLTLGALYGWYESGRPEMVHKWCYSEPMIKAALEDAGFKDVQFEEPQYHIPYRDLRAVARK